MSASAHPSSDDALSVRGADISFTLQEEAAGSRFRDLNGRPGSVEKIIANNGGNYVRQPTSRVGRRTHAVNFLAVC